MNHDSEPSKRNPLKRIMTGKKRAEIYRQSKKTTIQELREAYGIPPNVSYGDALKIATAKAGVFGQGDPASNFAFAVGAYLNALTAMTGNIIPIQTYWDEFLDLVEEADPTLAKIFATEFQQQFKWCLAGHIQRLSTEHNLLPKSVQTVEFYKKGKELIQAIRLQDGSLIFLPEGRYRRFDPCLILAGTEACPPLAMKDFKRLQKLDKKPGALLDLEKFKFTVPENHLFTADTVFNVAHPLDVNPIRNHLSILGFKPTRKK